MAYTVEEPSTLRAPLVFHRVGHLYVYVYAYFVRLASVRAYRECVLGARGTLEDPC